MQRCPIQRIRTLRTACTLGRADVRVYLAASTIAGLMLSSRRRNAISRGTAGIAAVMSRPTMGSVSGTQQTPPAEHSTASEVESVGSSV